MPRNATGNYNLPAGNPVVGGTKIQSSWANTTLQDIGSELSNSLDRQGRAAMTGPVKLADGTAAAPALTFNSDPNSGIFRIGPDEWALVAGGVVILTVKSDKLSTTLSAMDFSGTTFDPTDFVPSAGGTFSGDVTFTGAVQLNGAVNVGNRPAFAAMRTNGSVQNSGTNFIFPTEKFDNSNSFNVATGQFTAPRAGFYQFNAVINVQNNGVSAGFHCGFVKNGSTGTNGDELYGYCVLPLSNGQFGCVSPSALIYLAPGEVITCGAYTYAGANPLAPAGMNIYLGYISGTLLT